MVSPASAWNVLFDDFDNNVLDNEWSIYLYSADNWTYSESNSKLTVTDIARNGTEPTVYIVRSLSQAVSDFNLTFNFSWDSANSLDAVQNINVSLWDSNLNFMARAGYNDSWTGSSTIGNGKGVFYLYDSLGSSQIRPFGYDNYNMPYSGSASITISRESDNLMAFAWTGSGGTATYKSSTVNSDLLSGIAIQFSTYNYAQSFFGTEEADLISIESNSIDVIPEPLSCIILCFGLMAMYGKSLLKA